MTKDLYKDLYDAEWVRRDQVQSAVAIPVGLLTVLGGGLILFVQKYDGSSGLVTAFFGCCITLALGSYAAAAILLARSYHGFTYERIPWPSQIRNYHKGLLDYYAANGGNAEQADRDFEEFLRDRYIEATDRNSRNNAQRGALLYAANRWIVITLVLMGLAALPFTLSERQNVEKTHKAQTVPQNKTS